MDIDKLSKKFPSGVLRKQHPFYMADAISDIPACLAACMSPEMQKRITTAVEGFKPARIFAIGCGTSFNACQAAAYTLQKILQIPVIAMDAYDFELDTPPGIDQKTMLIAISESGQSITTCFSLEKSKELGAFTVGISANPGSRLSRSAKLALTDPFLHEIPLGKTRTYLSSALLAMLAGVFTREESTRELFVRQMTEVIDLIRKDSETWQITARKIANVLPVTRTRYVVTGFGAQKANADEIRLKVMEVLGESATSFSLEEFAHGPSACFSSDLTVIMLQTDDRTLEKAVRFSNGVVFSSAHLIVLTDQEQAGWPEKTLIIPLPRIENGDLFGLFPAIVAAQYLFYYLAIHKGLNPDVNLEDIHPELGDIYAFFFPPGTH
jgi:glucosamine 6-phosphate synthetase-like amidotransferase/phosphosugar isomerase protein